MANRVQLSSLPRRIAHSLPDNARGAVWMLAAALCFSLGDAMIKGVGGALHPLQINLLRAATGLVLLLPVVMWSRGRLARSRAPRLNLARAALEVAADVLIIFALTRVDLATVTALVHTRPLWLVVLSLVVLRAAVGWDRAGLALLGFAGVVLIARPAGAASLDPAVLGVLVAGACKAGSLLIARRASAGDPPLTIAVWQVTGLTLGTLVPALLWWRDAPPEALLLACGSGVFGLAGIYLMLRAVRIGETTVVAPLGYMQIVAAAVWGVLFFNAWPGAWTLAGAAVIALTGIILIRREATLPAASAPGSPSSSPTQKDPRS